MSQEQAKPIKYGDLFPISGDISGEPIAPQDAALMQATEARVMGRTHSGGAAAADVNVRDGFVGHDDLTEVAGKDGVTVTEAELPGTRIVTESVAGQVVGEIVQPTPVGATPATGESGITIGEALEATSLTAVNKPVESSDAAAIQAAEVRATGSNVITPGGISASAQAAVSYNESKPVRDEDKIKLGHVLTGATMKLAADKVATGEDAAGVIGAEQRKNPKSTNHPAGVAASLALAAKMNEAQSS